VIQPKEQAQTLRFRQKTWPHLTTLVPPTTLAIRTVNLVKEFTHVPCWHDASAVWWLVGTSVDHVRYVQPSHYAVCMYHCRTQQQVIY